jgi:hypothetical protein
LKDKNLATRFSFKDIMTYLSMVQKIKIGHEWKLPNTQKKLTQFAN